MNRQLPKIARDTNGDNVSEQLRRFDKKWESRFFYATVYFAGMLSGFIVIVTLSAILKALK